MIPTSAFPKITELSLNQFLKTQGQEGDFEYILVQRHESSSSGQRTRGLKLDDGGIAPFKYSVTYRCSRHGKARLNNSNRIRKVESKKLGIKEQGCPCRIVLNKYEGIEELVIMKNIAEHSHAIGSENVKFCKLTDELKEYVRDKFMKGISFPAVVALAEAFDSTDRDSAFDDRDIRAIENDVESIK